MSKIRMFASHGKIVLGSGSRYRRELLARLGVDFLVDPADIDESCLPGESPPQSARRLALAKARAVAARHPGAIVIGSDQVADLDGEAISKPGDHAAAVAQLRRLSGRQIRFHTALTLIDGAQGHSECVMVDTVVRYRTLDENTIEQYLLHERPYDCAGSARIESRGIALVESVTSEDPTALIGLPLIALVTMLRRAGVPVV
jgi:septum formation protein